MAGSYAPNGNRYIPQLTTQGTTDYAQIVVNETATDAWMQAVEVWEAATDAWMAERPMYGDTGYTTLAEALTTIGATQASLEIPSRSGAVAVAVSTVIPDNVQLIVREGAYFSVANGATLTINGPLEAGRYQIFSCTGTGNVVFGTTTTVYPEWWITNATPGTTDMTTAIQAAIDAFPSGSGIVKITGTNLVTDGLTIVNNYMTLYGDGENTEIVRKNGGSYVTLLVAPANPLIDHIEGTHIRNLNIFARTVAPTGGSHIKVQSGSRTTIDNVVLYDGFVGLHLMGNWEVRCYNVYVRMSDLFGSVVSGTRCLSISENTGNPYPSNTWVYFTDCQFMADPATQYTEIGVEITSADSIWFEDSYVGWIGVYGVFIENAAGTFIAGVYFNQCYFENCGGTGHVGHNVVINGDTLENIFISDCHISSGVTIGNCGIYIGATAAGLGIAIDNCSIWGFYSHGIQNVGVGMYGLSIRNCRIRRCNQGDIGASGISFADACHEFSIQNNQVGSVLDAGTQTQAYSISYGANAVNAIITGNICVGNDSNTITGTVGSNCLINYNLDT